MPVGLALARWLSGTGEVRFLYFWQISKKKRREKVGSHVEVTGRILLKKDR